MKLPTFFSKLTIITFLFSSNLLLGQCHTGGGAHCEHGGNKSESLKQDDEASASSEVIYYSCPMHFEIKSLKPGTCSKCKMNLEQKKATLYKIDSQIDSVYYTCSMNPEVNEKIPGSCSKCGMELIKKSTNAKSLDENMNKFSFKVYGNCGMCQATIEKAAKSADGVLKANWNKETKIIEVVSENKNTGSMEVSDAIIAKGYDTEYKIAGNEMYNKLPDCCKYERKKN